MKEETYNLLAEAFEQLARGYRQLAQGNVPTEEPQVTIEDVRAVLAAKSQDGKTSQVKALLMKYDADRLSKVKPENYAALFHDAEAL